MPPSSNKYNRNNNKKLASFTNQSKRKKTRVKKSSKKNYNIKNEKNRDSPITLKKYGNTLITITT